MRHCEDEGTIAAPGPQNHQESLNYAQGAREPANKDKGEKFTSRKMFLTSSQGSTDLFQNPPTQFE